MMTAIELAAKCVDIARTRNTVYMWGAPGMPVTKAAIDQKRAQPVVGEWYTADKAAKLSALIGKNYWGFDCVNLIKAVLWGWSGDASKTYGGAAYLSGGVPDVSADGAIGLCRAVTADFRGEIPVGAALWCSGHIGLYIGGGLAVECTPAWAGGVQITAVLNMGQKAGYNGRTWRKWGLLPWAEYDAPAGEDAGKPSPWAAEACAWAVENGIINGDGAGNYNWQGSVTREQLAVILYNFAKKSPGAV